MRHVEPVDPDVPRNEVISRSGLHDVMKRRRIAAEVFREGAVDHLWEQDHILIFGAEDDAVALEGAELVSRETIPPYQL